MHSGGEATWGEAAWGETAWGETAWGELTWALPMPWISAWQHGGSDAACMGEHRAATERGALGGRLGRRRE